MTMETASLLNPCTWGLYSLKNGFSRIRSRCTWSWLL